MTWTEVIQTYTELKKVYVPRRLREFRGARSYAQAAKELGCHRSYYCKCEHGDQELSDELTLKLLGGD